MTDLNELTNRLLGLYNFTLTKETLLENIKSRLKENGWTYDKEKPFIDENGKPVSEPVNGTKTRLNLYCNKEDKFGLIHGSFYPRYYSFLSKTQPAGCPECNKSSKKYLRKKH